MLPPNFAMFHLWRQERQNLEEMLVGPPLWPEFTHTPHLWEWGEGGTLGEGSRSSGSTTLRRTSSGARPLAHSWLPRVAIPSQVLHRLRPGQ